VKKTGRRGARGGEEGADTRGRFRTSDKEEGGWKEGRKEGGGERGLVCAVSTCERHTGMCVDALLDSRQPSGNMFHFLFFGILKIGGGKSGVREVIGLWMASEKESKLENAR